MKDNVFLVAALGIFVAAGEVSSCAWALECMGSVVVAWGLSCPAACGILAPQPGIKPTSPALQRGFLTTGHQGSPPPNPPPNPPTPTARPFYCPPDLLLSLKNFSILSLPGRACPPPKASVCLVIEPGKWTLGRSLSLQVS